MMGDYRPMSTCKPNLYRNQRCVMLFMRLSGSRSRTFKPIPKVSVFLKDTLGLFVHYYLSHLSSRNEVPKVPRSSHHRPIHNESDTVQVQQPNKNPPNNNGMQEDGSSDMFPLQHQKKKRNNAHTRGNKAKQKKIGKRFGRAGNRTQDLSHARKHAKRTLYQLSHTPCGTLLVIVGGCCRWWHYEWIRYESRTGGRDCRSNIENEGIVLMSHLQRLCCPSNYWPRYYLWCRRRSVVVNSWKKDRTSSFEVRAMVTPDAR
ncbi:hypothetical protein B0H65DRAFT_150804 [Neurospora tetraspora]|uniref:Uncharacterized protein n=1 Tax=Neurospora tetraspora TaxID=94610 RepID=A0AAE0MSI8_9PEZI|nr:hypothetical protein B0H65DRAFT_150804 [Neurospora tetraspora]